MQTVNLQRLSVLVLQSHEFVNEMLVKCLERLGFEHIHVALSVDEAYRLFNHYSPDFVLTDWDVKHGENGLKLIELIRNDQESVKQDVPIIMLTGYNLMSRFQRAAYKGIDDYVLKPFNVQRLVNSFTRIINQPQDFLKTKMYHGPYHQQYPDMMKMAGLKNDEMLKEYLIRVDRGLWAKAGSGNVQLSHVKFAEYFAEDLNFKPYARELISELGSVIDKASKYDDLSDFCQDVRQVIVAIKSSGAMFGFTILSDMADIMLSFIERAKNYDQELVEIIERHHGTLYYLVETGLTDESQIEEIKLELTQACDRYLNKYKQAEEV